PELRLALACARITLEKAEHEALASLLDGRIDWDRVLAFGARHGLLPLLHRHLQDIDARRMPKPVWAQLWGAYEITKSRHGRFAGELTRILCTLTGHHIDSVPYKGPVLAQALYGDVGLREFTDLDILVRRDDVLKARALLEAEGFQSEY